MITYKYTAEIVDVYPDSKTMNVIYRCDGHKDILVGVNLPEKREDLEGVIYRSVPFAVWYEEDRPVFVPDVGMTFSGSVVHHNTSPGFDASFLADHSAVDNGDELQSIPYSDPVFLRSPSLARRQFGVCVDDDKAVIAGKADGRD